MPLNPAIIGKEYQSGPFTVIGHESIYYALAVGDDNPAYFDPRRQGGIIAPPMYAAKYAHDPVDQIKADPEVGLNLEMLVHYAQEFHWLRPVRPGDRITSQATITNIEERENGAVLGIDVVCANQEGQLVVEARWELFDRIADQKRTRNSARPTITPGHILWQQEVAIPPWQTYTYAEPSGDRNPIHLDNAFARHVGLQGIILHGLCTMAITHRVAVAAFCGSDRNPLRLSGLRVQFARPVRPGETIFFKGFRIAEVHGGTKFSILAENEKGKAVLRDAWCVVA